jgi:oligopeptide/dipeptide ABC transporter ATP-binding protein
VKSLHDQIGMSLIWITHDLGVIAGLVDRVLVMYAGFLVEDAPVDEFYDHPLHPYAEGLLKSIPRMDAEVTEKLDTIEGLPPNLTEIPAECVFLKRCPYAQEICHQQMPPIFEMTPRHKAACWIDITSNTVREDMVSVLRQ